MEEVKSRLVRSSSCRYCAFWSLNKPEVALTPRTPKALKTSLQSAPNSIPGATTGRPGYFFPNSEDDVSQAPQFPCARTASGTFFCSKEESTYRGIKNDTSAPDKNTLSPPHTTNHYDGYPPIGAIPYSNDKTPPVPRPDSQGPYEGQSAPFRRDSEGFRSEGPFDDKDFHREGEIPFDPSFCADIQSPFRPENEVFEKCYRPEPPSFDTKPYRRDSQDAFEKAFCRDSQSDSIPEKHFRPDPIPGPVYDSKTYRPEPHETFDKHYPRRSSMGYPDHQGYDKCYRPEGPDSYGKGFRHDGPDSSPYSKSYRHEGPDSVPYGKNYRTEGPDSVPYGKSYRPDCSDSVSYGKGYRPDMPENIPQNMPPYGRRDSQTAFDSQPFRHESMPYDRRGSYGYFDARNPDSMGYDPYRRPSYGSISQGSFPRRHSYGSNMFRGEYDPHYMSGEYREPYRDYMRPPSDGGSSSFPAQYGPDSGEFYRPDYQFYRHDDLYGGGGYHQGDPYRVGGDLHSGYPPEVHVMRDGPGGSGMGKHDLERKDGKMDKAVNFPEEHICITHRDAVKVQIMHCEQLISLLCFIAIIGIALRC